MNKEIFNQVVNMDLKHQGFVAAAKVAMSAVESLKNNLDFRDAAKTLQSSMEKVQNSFDRFSSSPMANALGTVMGKFSSLEAVAFGALERIGQKAADTGIRIAKSLTVDQIGAGFNEYELKMGSVQTIMASTGESLETVNRYLGELNDYADQTIYSFSDMTSSIGKFTNAGVSLNDAVAAIKGISNEAALSGANAQQASHAMYNFSQALSSGSVKLIDWKSIENANMATKEFKNELIKTAVELGTVRKEGDKYISTTTDMNGKVSEAFTETYRFNDSLSAQWMTTDVLTKTLAKYADETTDLGQRAMHAAQDFTTWTQVIGAWKEAVGSGWARTFEIIIGDFEEAKKLWTSIDGIVSPFLNKMADDRNALLEGWDKLGGRDLLIDTLTGALTNLFNVIQAARDGVQWFVDWTLAGASAAEKMAEWTSKIAGFFKGLELNGAQLAIFSDIFETISIGVTDTIDTFKHVKDIVKNITDVLGSFKWMTEPIKGFFGALGDLGEKTIGKMQPALDKGNALLQHWKHIGDELHNIKYGLPKEEKKEDADTEETEKNAEKAEEKGLEADSIWQKVSNTISGALVLVDGVFRKIWDFVQSDVLGPIVDHATDFAKLAHGIGAVLHSVWGSVSPFIAGLGKLGASLIPKVVSGVANIAGGLGQILSDHAGDIGKLIHGALSLFGSLAVRIAPFVKSLGSLGESVIPKLISGFLTLTGKLGDFLSKVAEFVRTSSLLSAIGQSFSDIAEKVKGLFDRIGRNGAEGHISLLERFNNVIDRLKERLSPVVDKVKELFSNLKDGLKGAFAGGFTSPAAGAGILAGLVVMIKTASKALTNVIESFKSNIDLKGLFGGFADKLKGIFEPLNDYLEKMSMLKNVEIIEKVAKALLMLAGALVAISVINPDRLGSSLVALAVLMTEIAGMTVVLSKVFSGKKAIKSMISIVGAMNQISQAILVLSASLWIVSSIDGESLQNGLAAIGWMMGYMIAFSAMASTIKDGSGLKNVSSALKKVASATVVMAFVLKLLGAMEWSELGVALAGMAGGLAALTASLILLGNLSENNPASAAAALLITSAALIGLAAALKIVGTMDWAELGVAAAGLGGGLVVLCGALALLGYIGGPVMLGAAAMAVASLSIIGLAAAIRLLASIDMKSIVTAVLAIVAVLGTLTAVSILLTNTAGLLGLLALSIALGTIMKKLGKVLNKAASAFMKVAAALAIISQLSLAGKGEAAAEAMTAIAKAAGQLIFKTFSLTTVGAALKNLGEGLKAIMDAASGGPDTLANAVTAVEAFVNATLVAISTAVPQIIGIVLALIQGILAAINEHIGDILSLIASILVQILAALSEWAPTIGLALGVVLMRVLEGLGATFNVIGATILASLKDLVVGGIALILSMVQSVAEKIPGVGGLISDKIGEWIENLNETFGEGSNFHADKLLDGFESELSAEKDKLVDKTKGFGKEVKDGFISGFSEALSGSDSEDGGALSGFLSALTGHESEVEGTGQGYGSLFLSGFESSFAGEDGTVSIGGVDSLLSAITGSEEQFKGGGETVANATVSGFEAKFIDEAPKAGESAVDLFITPFLNSEEKARPAGETLAASTASGADSKKDAFESAANNAVDGFVNASDLRRQDAYNAGARIAESYNLGLRNTMEIESPSKVTYRDGEYTVDGYINAIYDKTKEVERAGAVTAKAAENGLTAPLSSISDILSGEFDDAMTITPVMDLSQIQNDASRLRDMLDSARVSVGRMDISGIMPDYSRSDRADDRTLNELKGLRKDMADFNERLANMQVRMDTGELVGTLASPMDRELGRRAALKARR